MTTAPSNTTPNEQPADATRGTAATSTSVHTPEVAAAPNLATRIEELSTRLAGAHAAIDRMERARHLERAAASAGALDPHEGASVIARELDRVAAGAPGAATGAIAAAPEGPIPSPAALERAIRQARAGRPDLFKPARPRSPLASPMSAGHAPAHAAPVRDSTRRAAADAQGDRKALLDYMRARRMT